jgi:hypothetical protein
VTDTNCIIGFRDKRWLNKKGKLHRLDGPAIETDDGSQEWYVNGKLHRVGAPAAVTASGNKYWYINDRLHRLDGPAYEGRTGMKEWWINGKPLIQQQFERHPLVIFYRLCKKNFVK